MKKSIIWIVVIIIVIIGIVIWRNNQAPYVAPAADQTPAASDQTPPAPVIVLNTATSSKLGSFLVAVNGVTLYHFTKDSVGTSTCTGTCATTWPPYTVVSSATLTGGPAATGTVSTITRDDGTIQITYNGMPLYFYSKDQKPGDTLGQNVNKTWFVVRP